MNSLEARAETLKKFSLLFLVEKMTPKSPLEINWPVSNVKEKVEDGPIVLAFSEYLNFKIAICQFSKLYYRFNFYCLANSLNFNLIVKKILNVIDFIIIPYLLHSRIHIIVAIRSARISNFCPKIKPSNSTTNWSKQIKAYTGYLIAKCNK